MPPFVVTNKPVFFAQDNIHFEETTPDGTNTLYGTTIVMFQQETREAPLGKEIKIDQKIKKAVSFSDCDACLSQLSTATLLKPPVEKFSAYNYFTMFQQETGEAPMSKEIRIDQKSKETVSFSDYDASLSQLSTATLMKPPVEMFFAYNCFTKWRQSQVYEIPIEKTAIKDLILLLCYLHCQWREKSHKEGEIGMHDPVSVTVIKASLKVGQPSIH